MIRLVATRATARAAVLLMTAATLTVTAAPAAAQLSVGSGQTNVFGASTRGNDSAHDPVNNVFLVVSAFGPVRGLFVNAQGGPVGSVFTVSGTSHSNYPRVAYSADLKGFLVVWTAEEGASFVVRSRTVVYPGTMGPERTISDGTTAWLEAAPALAYSATSKQFLVAWQGVGPVKARLVGNDGAAVGAAQELSGSWGRDPGVAWNSDLNEFGVSFNGEAPGRSGFSVFVIVPATNLAALRRTTFNALGGGTLTNITDVAYSTKSRRYVMTWYEDGIRTKVATFDDGGGLLSHTTVSSRLGIYDSLSIAFNPTSQTFLLVGLDPQSDRLTGMELNANGAQAGSETVVGPSPGWYARVSTSSNSAAWMTSYSRSFTTSLVPVTTASLEGGPSGVAPASPDPAPTVPSPSPSCPGSAPVLGWVCLSGDWRPGADEGTGSGSGGSTPSGGDGSCPGGVIPGMTCVNGSYVADSSSSSGSGSGGSTPSGGDGSCAGGVIAGMTCVNGEYQPSGSSTGGSQSGSSGGDGSCAGGMIAGMTCVNGEYQPSGSSTGGSQSGNSGGDNSCAGGVIPGMTCVNGEYQPTGSSSGSGSSSSGGDGSCAGGVIAGMTCVNGSYTPTTTSTPTTSTSSLPVCSTGITVGPGPDFVRVGATEWMHSSHPQAANATCRSAG